MAGLSFDGQTVIVTGGGRGLGRSHALDFAKRGAAVVVNEIRDGLAQSVVDEITAGGGRAVANSSSITTTKGAQSVVDSAVENFGAVDVLVNNAGVLRTGYFADLSDADIDDVLDVHLRAAFRITQLVWPLMTERNYGRVIMTSSASGMFSHQGLASYAAAKAGLYGLTKALAFEGIDRGIKVNAILPNSMTEAALSSDIPDMLEYSARYARLSPEAFQDQIANWRWEPKMITALVTYLASPQCEYNGEAFSALAGRYARVFVGIADGWIAPDESSLTAEDVAAHIDEVRDISNPSVPMWLYNEQADVADRISAMAART